jgi:hypothetical protein
MHSEKKMIHRLICPGVSSRKISTCVFTEALRNGRKPFAALWHFLFFFWGVAIICCSVQAQLGTLCLHCFSL